MDEANELKRMSMQYDSDDTNEKGKYITLSFIIIPLLLRQHSYHLPAPQLINPHHLTVYRDPATA